MQMKGVQVKSKLGGRGNMKLLMAAFAALVFAGCLAAPRPVLTPTQGSVAVLRGSERIAIYGDDEDLEIIRAELLRIRPGLEFTTADYAQVLLTFQFTGTPSCIDCGPGFGEGPFQPVLAFGTVERSDDRDHCLPKLLRADWTGEAYRRVTLARRFAQTVGNQL